MRKVQHASWRDCAKAVRSGAISGRCPLEWGYREGFPGSFPSATRSQNGTQNDEAYYFMRGNPRRMHRLLLTCCACASLESTLPYPPLPSLVPYELLDIEESSAPFETTTDDNYHTFTQLRFIPTIRLISSEHSRH